MYASMQVCKYAGMQVLAVLTSCLSGCERENFLPGKNPADRNFQAWLENYAVYCAEHTGSFFRSTILILFRLRILNLSLGIENGFYFFSYNLCLHYIYRSALLCLLSYLQSVQVDEWRQAEYRSGIL